jgi:hypothetical protein
MSYLKKNLFTIFKKKYKRINNFHINFSNSSNSNNNKNIEIISNKTVFLSEKNEDGTPSEWWIRRNQAHADADAAEPS